MIPSTFTMIMFHTKLTLKVPEKLQLYGLYVYYVVHICDFGMLRVKCVMGTTTFISIFQYSHVSTKISSKAKTILYMLFMYPLFLFSFFATLCMHTGNNQHCVVFCMSFWTIILSMMWICLYSNLTVFLEGMCITTLAC